MTASYEELLRLEFPEVHCSYSERDTMLYAMSLGVGSEPTSPEQLRMVYERDLRAIPTMAVTLAHPGFWARDMETGLDYTRIVHGAQRLKMHRTLPVSADIVGRSRIRDVVDKGPEKGALVYFERTLFNKSTNDALCSMEQTLFCRGDGGIGGPCRASASQHAMPDRAPDAECRYELLPQTALLYRLNGDMNPLHADPSIAKQAGFEKPILQGLATYAIAGLAIIQHRCANNPENLLELDARFTAPVYPGETLLSQIWYEDDALVSARVLVPERGVVAIDNCRAVVSQA